MREHQRLELELKRDRDEQRYRLVSVVLPMTITGFAGVLYSVREARIAPAYSEISSAAIALLLVSSATLLAIPALRALLLYLDHSRPSGRASWTPVSGPKYSKPRSATGASSKESNPQSDGDTPVFKSTALNERAPANSRRDEADDLVRAINATRTRLKRTAAEVGRRGNVNLAFGMLIAGIGLVFLAATSVSITPEMFGDFKKSLPWILVRLALVVAIEILAYFFLKMYRSAHEERRYINNEMTGAESRALAVVLATRNGDQPVAAELVKILMSVDRNQILQKDQTTRDIEHARIEAEKKSDLTKLLLDALKSTKQ